MSLFARFSAVLLAGASMSAMAGSIPYGNPGTVAPTSTIYATGNGVTVYFFGSGAYLASTVRIADLNTGYNSGDFFNNYTTQTGAMMTLGATGTKPSDFIHTGDELIFYINSPNGLYASLPQYSADGINHAYFTSFDGGIINNVNVPAGMYAGLEDGLNGGDFSYNDDSFIFTNVGALSSTPEPGSWALLGTGLAGVVGAVRRRRRS